VIARHRAWADSTSLKTIASAAAGLPAPRVTFVRSLTVENVDSIGFVPGMKVVGAAVRVLVTRLRPGCTVRPSGRGTQVR
jgi:hypothetical protein